MSSYNNFYISNNLLLCENMSAKSIYQNIFKNKIIIQQICLRQIVNRGTNISLEREKELGKTKRKTEMPYFSNRETK